jgi:hypothetical protein
MVQLVEKVVHKHCLRLDQQRDHSCLLTLVTIFSNMPEEKINTESPRKETVYAKKIRTQAIRSQIPV